MRYHELISEGRVVLDKDHDLGPMIAWKNPTHVELRRLLDQFGSLRGYADPDGPLWVWDANTWVHGTIGKYIGFHRYYLYFSKTKKVNAEEWLKQMKRVGDVYVGAKFEDDRGRNRPDIVLATPSVVRALSPAAAVSPGSESSSG